MRKSVWLLSAGLFAISAPAMAQQTDPATPGQPAQQESPTEAASVEGQTVPPSATEPTDAGEIVVTAQGRAQVLQDVPIADTAVNAETLQNSGATDIRQLNQVSPSLLVSGVVFTASTVRRNAA